MNIQKILVAYDGSEESEKAFDMALDLAGKYSAQVAVVSVARPSEPPAGVAMDTVLEVAAEYYHTRFSDLRKKASGCGVESRFKISAGLTLACCYDRQFCRTGICKTHFDSRFTRSLQLQFCSLHGFSYLIGRIKMADEPS